MQTFTLVFVGGDGATHTVVFRPLLTGAVRVSESLRRGEVYLGYLLPAEERTLPLAEARVYYAQLRARGYRRAG